MSVISRFPTFDLHLMTPEPAPKPSSMLVAAFEVIFGTFITGFFGFFGPKFTEIALTHPNDAHAGAGLTVGLVMTGFSIFGLAIATLGAIRIWKGREP